MVEEKTPIPLDVELRVTPPKPDTIRDDQKLPEKISQDVTDKYARYAGEAPDGGFKAWSVVLASMLTTFCTFGYVNSSWGVFQAYYEQVLLSDKSPSTIAWIGSVQYTFIYLPGLATGRLFDLGHFKIPYFFSSCGLVACTFLTAECKQYWQFLLVQGVFTGLFSGIIYAQAISVISHWFAKKKGMVLGIVSIGTSLGGTLFPIAGQKLLAHVGFKWTVRAFGFMMLFALGIANLCLLPS